MTEEMKRKIGGTVGTILCAVLAFIIGFSVRTLLPAKEAAQGVNPMVAYANQPRTVATALVAKRVINPPVTYMGHVEPIQDVDLRAQIDGTIAAVAFKEGAMVKEGDLLYLIAPSVYEAKVAQCKAELEKAKAVSTNADRYHTRMSKVDKRSVTETEIDQAYANMLEGRAAIAQAEANLRSAEINLGYTRISAPISGHIGKSLLKKGDYVSPSMGSLARIVQTDPVRVVFSVSDKDYVREAQKDRNAPALCARLLLPTGNEYPVAGTLDFISNEMNAATASLPVRYRFPNPDQLLLANAYVSVLLSATNPPQVLAIPSEAILTNAKGDYVYVNVDGKAVQHFVKLGAQQKAYVEILEGLKENDEVVTEGVVNVVEGAKLNVIDSQK
ncbi:MAG: efflux RND transporter periplasmic adaptor subunit [Kiritimatiellia bacterium]